MRKAIFLLLILLIGGAIAYAFLRTPAEGPATLAQAIAAHGGEAGIERIRTGKITGHGQMADHLGMRYPMHSIQEYFQPPNFYKQLIVIDDRSGKPQTIGVLAPAGKRWRTHGEDGKLEVVTRDTTDEQGMLAFLQELLGIHRRKLPLTPLPVEEVLGRQALGFQTSLDDNPLSLYFDRETKLCVKFKRKLPNAPENKGILEMVLANYRDIEGVQVPMKLTITVDGKLFREVEIDTVQFVERLPSDTFQAP